MLSRLRSLVQQLGTGTMSAAGSIAPADVRAKLNAILSRGDGWEQTYLEKATPWDAGRSQPALLELLRRSSANELAGTEVPTRGTAVVPGCGRGYDVYALAAHGLDATGIDISPTALDGARQWAAEQTKPAGKLDFVQTDIFEDRSLTASYDVAYDYTFFCAFPYAMRPKIGELYARLVKPGGLLLALQFPLGDDGGSNPPYPVSPEAYTEAFGAQFEQVPIDKIEAAMPQRKGRENMSVWRRK